MSQHPQPNKQAPQKQKDKVQGHFDIRLMERFAISLTESETKELINKIKNYDKHPEYTPLIIAEDGNAFHRLEIQGQIVIALFDWKRYKFITCLYPTWLSFIDGEWVLRRKHPSKSKYIRQQNKYKNKAYKSDF